MSTTTSRTTTSDTSNPMPASASSASVPADIPSARSAAPRSGARNATRSNATRSNTTRHHTTHHTTHHSTTRPELFRADPRTTLLVMLLLNITMFSAGFAGFDAAARVVFVLIPAILSLGMKRYLSTSVYLALTLLALLIEHRLLVHDLDISNAVVVGIAGLVTRLAPGLFLGYVAVISIQVGELMAALDQLRTPRQVVIPAAVVLRFIPTVREEFAAVAGAMSARGITLRRVGPLAWIEYRLVPLMISTVKSGEELAQAALTRGLGRPGTTEHICVIRFRLVDFTILTLTAIGMGLWIVG
ncbi:MAG: energy-coupling factor transporter transmembrane component T [Ancrocorticia sp.]